METQKNDKSLTDHSLSGFSWLAGRTVVTRLVQYGGQIVLAWLLEPKAFGLIGMAYSIQAFATLVQQSGIDKVLVAKQDQFDELANPGFWGALATGLVAGGLMFVSAPIAADLLNSPGLTDLILILAIATPFKALWLVPQARLSIDLRFDLQAIINAGAIVLQMALTIALATQGFGAMSFVLPALIVNPLIAAVLYGLTRPPLHWTPEFAKWHAIAKASGLLILATVLSKSVSYGDYLILGSVYQEDEVGIYYMAFALAVQPIMLLSNNVTSTLFPVLSKLQKSQSRQQHAFLRSVRLAVITVTPLSFLLSATAEPLIELFLDPRWRETVVLVQVMALGMSFQVLDGMAYAYLNAQKRFATVATVGVLRVCVFFGLVISAVSWGVWKFTLAVSISYFSISFAYLYFAFNFSWSSFKEVLGICTKVLFGSCIALALSLSIVDRFSESYTGDIISLICCMLIFFGNVMVLLFLERDAWEDIKLLYEQIALT